MSTPASHSVVVGLDGSDASTAAALWGASVASKWGATLSLVHALPQDGPLYSPAAIMLESQFLSQLREDGEAIIGTAKRLLGPKFPGLEIETTISPGPAGTALLEAADWARLIVLGSTGAGAFRSVLVGSTALARGQPRAVPGDRPPGRGHRAGPASRGGRGRRKRPQR